MNPLSSDRADGLMRWAPPNLNVIQAYILDQQNVMWQTDVQCHELAGYFSGDAVAKWSNALGYEILCFSIQLWSIQNEAIVRLSSDDIFLLRHRIGAIVVYRR
jgi:hypothetical protein